MKVILLNLKKQLNNENTLAAISCVILSFTIFFIKRIMDFHNGF